jgi:hypothetical protein
MRAKISERIQLKMIKTNPYFCLLFSKAIVYNNSLKEMNPLMLIEIRRCKQ